MELNRAKDEMGRATFSCLEGIPSSLVPPSIEAWTGGCEEEERMLERMGLASRRKALYTPVASFPSPPGWKGIIRKVKYFVAFGEYGGRLRCFAAQVKGLLGMRRGDLSCSMPSFCPAEVVFLLKGPRRGEWVVLYQGTWWRRALQRS